MRLSAAILCAFLSFSFIAAPTVEAAQKKPAAVKVVKKKAVKKTVVEKTAKKKVVAASAKKKAKAPKAKAAGKRVAVKSVVRKRASARSSSRKFASSKNYRPRKAIDWATYPQPRTFLRTAHRPEGLQRSAGTLLDGRARLRHGHKPSFV